MDKALAEENRENETDKLKPEQEIAKVDDAEEEVDHRCGLFGCHPASLQRCNTARWLLLMMSMSFFARVVMFGTLTATITTLERRFGLSSVHIGLIRSSSKAVRLLLIIPISHMANVGHKGRWIGMGCMLMTVGALVMVSAQFVTPSPDMLVLQARARAKADNAGALVPIPDSVKCPVEWKISCKVSTVTAFHRVWDCPLDDPLAMCEPRGANDSSLSDSGEPIDHLTATQWLLPLVLLMCGSMCIGLATIPMSAVGTLYIDENVTQNASPAYVAVYHSVGVVGNVFGYVLTAACLRIHADFLLVDTAKLDVTGPDDDRWVGAWWLAMLIGALPVAVCALPLFCFPGTLPETARLRAKDRPMTHGQSSRDSNFKLSWATLHKQILVLFKIPFYTITVFVHIFFSIFFSGFFMLFPKIMENFFNFSPSVASLVAGLLFTPVFVISNVVGGFILRRLKFNVIQNFRYVLALQLVHLVGLTALTQWCPGPRYAGVTVGYMTDAQPYNTSTLSQCNLDCQCGDYFKPVCNEQLRVSYYSPCHAGCSGTYSVPDVDETDGEKSFWSNCTCFDQRVRTLGETFGNASMVLEEGNCAHTCHKVYIFIAISVVVTFVTSLATPSMIQLNLRIIPMHLRAVGRAITKTTRTIGSIPGALFSGWLLDQLCVLWNGRGRCVRYDVHALAYYLLALGMLSTTTSVVVNIINMVLYKPPINTTAAEANGNTQTEQQQLELEGLITRPQVMEQKIEQYE